MEYDILKREIAKHYWRADRYDDSYMYGRNTHKDMKRVFELSKIKTVKPHPPDGKFTYL